MIIKHSDNCLHNKSDFKNHLFSSRRISLGENNSMGIFLKSSNGKKVINPKQINIEYKANLELKNKIKSRNNCSKKYLKYLRDSSFLQINYYKLFRKMKLRNSFEIIGGIGGMNKTNLNLNYNYNPLINYLNVEHAEHYTRKIEKRTNTTLQPSTNRNLTRRREKKSPSILQQNYLILKPLNLNTANSTKNRHHRDLFRNNSIQAYAYNHKNSNLIQKNKIEIENPEKIKFKYSERINKINKLNKINGKSTKNNQYKLICPNLGMKNHQKIRISGNKMNMQLHTHSKTNNLFKDDIQTERKLKNNDFSPW